MGQHYCHWTGCQKEVSPNRWGCIKHWFMLPARLRAKILVTYRPDQEITKTPSKEYIEAAKEVQAWIATIEVPGSK